MTPLKPYPAYRNSGVDWLGDMPEHWGRRRMKTLVRLKAGESITSDSIEENGPYPVFGGNGIRGYSDAFTHSGAFALIGRQGALCGNVHFVDGTFWASEHAIVATPSTNLDMSWLARTLRAMNLGQYSISAAQPGIGVETISDLLLPCPPLDEQRAIAAFLDAMDARITRFIAARKKMIRLLEEKKQAVINQAVTKGIDPTVPMKDSGVDWLGEIPAHWEVRKVKQLANGDPKSFTDGDWIESPYIQSEGIRLIQTGNIGRGTYREQGYRYISEETFRELNCTEVEVDDILVCRLGDPVSRACLTPNLEVKMITSVDVCIIKPAHDVEPLFIVFAMSSDGYLEWVKGQVRGSTRDRISRSMLGSFTVPFPPMADQREIAAALKERTTSIETAKERAEREIGLINEHRTRLISDVVTGKLDVRGVDLGALPMFEELVGLDNENDPIEQGDLAEIEVDS